MHRACKPSVKLSVLASVTVSEREASSACSSDRRPQNTTNLHTVFMPAILDGNSRNLIPYGKLAINALGRVFSRSRRVSTIVINHARVAPLCPTQNPLNRYANAVQITIVKSAYTNPSPSSSSSSSSFHIDVCVLHPHLHLTASFRGVGG